MGEIYQVDAFAERLFSGNPAYVVLLDAPSPDTAWMQALAGETRLPATAFVHRVSEGQYAVQWFSPTAELELCGHGTLASAHVLFERGDATDSVRFDTRSAGVLEAAKRGERVELDFPALRGEPAAAPTALLEGLGCKVVNVERGNLDLLVEVESEAVVRTLQPDVTRLQHVEARGVIVTALAQTEPGDFVSRFFAPSVGLPEDAVTGSAHCALGPYWAGRLGREQLTGVQLSARRGVVHVTMRGDRVTLAGTAVTVMRGRLTSDPLEQWRTTQAQLVAGFGEVKGVEPPLVSTPGPR